MFCPSYCLVSGSLIEINASSNISPATLETSRVVGLVALGGSVVGLALGGSIALGGSVGVGVGVGLAALVRLGSSIGVGVVVVVSILRSLGCGGGTACDFSLHSCHDGRLSGQESVGNLDTLLVDGGGGLVSGNGSGQILLILLDLLLNGLQAGGNGDVGRWVVSSQRGDICLLYGNTSSEILGVLAADSADVTSGCF